MKEKYTAIGITEELKRKLAMEKVKQGFTQWNPFLESLLKNSRKTQLNKTGGKNGNVN